MTIQDMCYKHLPNGKREGKEWVVGSLAGESGKSCKIAISGARAGIWCDFATQESGDALDLYARLNRLSIADAIQQAKSELGIANTPFQNTKKHYKKPPKPKCSNPKSKVFDWLTIQRGLTQETIEDYRIGENQNSVIFPSLRDGELIRWKSRSIQDKHKCQTSSDSEPCLFGWQVITDTARQVVITEGEIDSMSWHQIGYPALSVPSGAKSLSWINCEYDNLERFDTIYLSMDMDQPGQEVIPEIIERLGRERVRVVNLPEPFKDINELLLSDFSDYDSLIRSAATMDPSELRSASDYVLEVVDEFYNADHNDYGTPWQKKNNELRFRKGEVIVLAGINKHGKSIGVGHIALSAIAGGEKFCIASMEFKPSKWFKTVNPSSLRS